MKPSWKSLFIKMRLPLLCDYAKCCMVGDFLQSWPQKRKIRRIEIKDFCAGKPCLISKAVECVLKPVQLKDSDLGLKLNC